MASREPPTPRSRDASPAALKRSSEAGSGLTAGLGAADNLLPEVKRHVRQQVVTVPMGLDSTSSDASTLQLKVFHEGQSMTLSDAMQHRPSAVYMEKIRNSLDLTVAYKPDGHGSRDGWHTYRSGKTEHEKQKEALPPLETANSNRASNRTSRRTTPNSSRSDRQASRRSYLIKRGDLPARSFDGAGSSVQVAPRAPPIRWQFAGGPPPRLPPMKSPAAARAGAAHRRVSTPSWESPLPDGGGFRSRRARNALQEQERAVQANPNPNPNANPNPNPLPLTPTPNPNP